MTEETKQFVIRALLFYEEVIQAVGCDCCSKDPEKFKLLKEDNGKFAKDALLLIFAP